MLLVHPIAASYLALGEVPSTVGDEMLWRWGCKEVPWIRRDMVLLILVMAKEWNWAVCFAGNHSITQRSGHIFVWARLRYGIVVVWRMFLFECLKLFLQVKHFLPGNHFEMKSKIFHLQKYLNEMLPKSVSKLLVLNVWLYWVKANEAVTKTFRERRSRDGNTSDSGDK